MPAQYFSVVTLVGQGRIAAAIAGEGAVAIAQLAAGDGNGAPTIPAVNQQGLVHEIWRGAVASVARDPAHPTQVIVRGTIPGSVGPAIIRELGVYSAAGELVAVANYPATEIAAAGQGALTDIVVDFIFVVDTAAPVTIQVNSNDLVYLQDQRRAPFIAIDGFTNVPPANPAEDTLVVAGAAPTGAFAGSAHYFFQWNGLAGLWRQALAHQGTVVFDKANGTYWRRTLEGWELWEASRTRKGIGRIATVAEVAAGESETTAVCPKDLSDALGELADTPLANVGANGVGLVKGLAQNGSAWELRKVAATGGIVAAVAEGGEVVVAGPAHVNAGNGVGIVGELAVLQDGSRAWRHRSLVGSGAASVAVGADGETVVVHADGGRFPGEVVIRQRSLTGYGQTAQQAPQVNVGFTQTILPKAAGTTIAVSASCRMQLGLGGDGLHLWLDAQKHFKLARRFMVGGAWGAWADFESLAFADIGLSGSLDTGYQLPWVTLPLVGDIGVPDGCQSIEVRYSYDRTHLMLGAKVEVIEYQTLV